MPDQPKILVIQTAFIGDVILVTPLFSALKQRFPQAWIECLTTPAAGDVLRNNPHVNRLIAYDKHDSQKGLAGLIRLMQQLKHSQYHVVLAPHRSWRTALLVHSSGAPTRIGFDKNSGAWWYTHRCRYDTNQHETVRNLSLLSALGIHADAQPPEIYPDEENRTAVDRLTAKAQKNACWVALAPGSVWPTKRWPESHYRDLAARLIADQCTVFLVGGEEDRPLCQRIAEDLPPQGVDASGQLSLRATAALLRRCRILATNDSAPMHLASATATLTLALFGPTVPAFGFGPYSRESVVLEKPLDCRPCTTHGSQRCPIKTHACLEGITVTMVYDQLQKMINKR